MWSITIAFRAAAQHDRGAIRLVDVGRFQEARRHHVQGQAVFLDALPKLSELIGIPHPPVARCGGGTAHGLHAVAAQELEPLIRQRARLAAELHPERPFGSIRPGFFLIDDSRPQRGGCECG
jgi:hypothetical protein